VKQIDAVIPKPMLQEVQNALDGIGVKNFMESAIICHGNQKGQVMIYRGARFVANIVEKVKLEIIATDDSVDKIIKVISSIAKAGNGEDCRISLRPYLEVA
jgi:nitrogen regulatory protein PII